MLLKCLRDEVSLWVIWSKFLLLIYVQISFKTGRHGPRTQAAKGTRPSFYLSLDWQQNHDILARISFFFIVWQKLVSWGVCALISDLNSQVCGTDGRGMSLFVQRPGTPYSAGVLHPSEADLHLIVCPCSKTRAPPAIIAADLAQCVVQLQPHFWK